MDDTGITPDILPEDLVRIQEFAEQYYDTADDLHGLGHVQRVLTHARKIWEKEGGNWNVINAIIWLHDIGRKTEEVKKTNHAILSKKIAHPFLQSISLNSGIISQILHGIEAHSFSLGISARSLEAKIVSDADKLDALGAVGIFRVCAYQATYHHGIKAVIAHSYKKLFQLKSQLYLPTSQSFGEIRTNRIQQFITDLEHELKN